MRVGVWENFFHNRGAAVLAGNFLFSPAFPERKDDVYQLRGIAGQNFGQSIKRCEKFEFSTLVKLCKPNQLQQRDFIKKGFSVHSFLFLLQGSITQGVPSLTATTPGVTPNATPSITPGSTPKRERPPNLTVSRVSLM
jgi:hypothetical protein